MRVHEEAVKFTIYRFTNSEFLDLVEMGIWDLLKARLRKNERMEVDD